MNQPDDNNTEIVSSATGEILHNITCIACGYNLRGLQEHQTCAECGHTIAESLAQYRQLSHSGYWIERVANGLKMALRGFYVYLAAIVLIIFAIAIIFGVLIANGGGNGFSGAGMIAVLPMCLAATAALVGCIMLVIGVYQFTSKREGEQTNEALPAWRRRTRLFMTLMLAMIPVSIIVAIIAQFLMMRTPRAGFALLGVLQIAQGIIWVGLSCSLFFYAGLVAKKIMQPGLATFGKVLGWGFVATGGISIVMNLFVSLTMIMTGASGMNTQQQAMIQQNMSYQTNIGPNPGSFITNTAQTNTSGGLLLDTSYIVSVITGLLTLGLMIAAIVFLIMLHRKLKNMLAKTKHAPQAETGMTV